MATPTRFAVGSRHTVSALTLLPSSARACFVFAHGAGAGMAHAFMESFADGLAAVRIATFRYQFPYMDQGSRRPDPPALCHATVRAAVDEATRISHGLPLIAGGRSFGGRMTSQAQSSAPLPGVRGLAFLGFPLHPAKKPADARAAHLADVSVPMLFLQGDHDELADLALLRAVIDRLGERATLHLIPDADHSFHVPARSGRKDSQVLEDLVRDFQRWTGILIGS